MPPPYKPVGRCIYCGKRPEEAGPKGLTEEHIVPYALSGDLILPEASCSDCQDITHAFEGHLAGKMLEAARAHFHWRSRKRKRPQALPAGSLREPVTIPREEHPPAILLPILGPPGILLNQEPQGNTVQMLGFGVYVAPEFLGRLQKLADVGGISVPLRIDWLARTLAKIAHAYSVAELGVSGFQHLLPPLILGTGTEFSHYVGSAAAGQSSTPAPELHTLGMRWSDDLLVISVRLYAKYDALSYLVVSGRRNP